jgi:hypothetical protein
MLRTMMKSRIRRAAVTQANLHSVGSVTVDADNRVLATRDDPAETFGAPRLVRGDSTG